MKVHAPHDQSGPAELVERYLQSVRFLLPRRQRDDVHRELSAEIRDAVEEQEAAQGRPLDADQVTAVLQRFGHPLTLALRYQPSRTVAAVTCCTSDLTLAEFRTLRAKMDASVPSAATAQGYLGRSPAPTWRASAAGPARRRPSTA